MSEPPRDVASLVPQTGAMVLLDAIISHDAEGIACLADSHRDPGNPLRRDGVLPIWAGIEYAAQAMAAHFSHRAGVSGEATIGLLGGVRDVECAVERLDDVDSPLVVTARRLSHDRAGSIYFFVIKTKLGERELMRGRATVVQQTRDAT